MSTRTRYARQDKRFVYGATHISSVGFLIFIKSYAYIAIAASADSASIRISRRVYWSYNARRVMGPYVHATHAETLKTNEFIQQLLASNDDILVLLRRDMNVNVDRRRRRRRMRVSRWCVCTFTSSSPRARTHKHNTQTAAAHMRHMARDASKPSSSSFIAACTHTQQQRVRSFPLRCRAAVAGQTRASVCQRWSRTTVAPYNSTNERNRGPCVSRVPGVSRQHTQSGSQSSPVGCFALETTATRTTTKRV